MTFIDWLHRHFTRLGRDIAWRERYAQRHGHAYPGHVPPRPMPAPAAPASEDTISGRWKRAGFDSKLSDEIERVLSQPAARPVGPISLAERAARFQRGMEVIHSLSPACLRMMQEDGRILSEVASRVKPAPPRPRHHGMVIIAQETIMSGQLVHLDACADGSFIARARRFGHA